MDINKEKLERQLLGVDIWKDNNFNGIFDYATGVGKTHLTTLCIEENERIDREVYMIVTPGPVILKQWETKLKDCFPKHLLSRIIFKTAQSVLLEQLHYEVDVLIIDEIHEFSSEERIKIVDSTYIKCKKFIGLTANADDKNFKQILKYYKVIDSIGIKEAKERGFVADFIEYNLGLHLTKREKETYDALSETISKHMPKFNNDLSLASKVIYGGKDKHQRYYSGAGWAEALARKNGWNRELNFNYPNHKAIDDIWNPGKIIGYAKSLNTAVKVRMDLLYNATAKFNTTVEILEKFNDVKAIVFSESTAFADKIYTILTNTNQKAVVYHSQLKTKIIPSPKSGKPIKLGNKRQKDLALDAIKTNKARIFCAAKSVDKGLDVPDFRLSVTTSGTQGTTQYTQRTGRAIRKEEQNVDAEAPVLLINLYIIDTQDEKWLINRQANISHTPITITSVDDIVYRPPANFEYSLNSL